MTGRHITRAEPGAEPTRDVLRIVLGPHAAAVAATLARLDIAELLANGPRSAEDMATDAGTSSSGMLRLLRAAASLGLVDEHDDATFAGNARTRCFIRGPGSLRDVAIAMMEPSCFQLLQHLPDAVAKQAPVAADALGTDIWSYRDSHPQARLALIDTLVDLDRTVLPAVREHVDLAGIRCVVQVGGGFGTFLAELLRHAPKARGVLFDRPRVVERARRMSAGDVAGRIRFAEGDFLERVPPSGDLYVLKGLLHDLDDESASLLLDSCYMAAAPGSTLLAIEGVLSDGAFGDPVSRLLDINALVTVNGRERTIDEVEDLFNGAGYTLEKVVPLEQVTFRSICLLIGRRS